MTPQDSAAAEREAIVAERDALANRVQSLEAELNSLRAQLESARSELALTASRAVRLAQAGHDAEKINAALPSLGTISDALFELMLNPAPAMTASQMQATPIPKKVVGEDQEKPAAMSWEHLFAPAGRS